MAMHEKPRAITKELSANDTGDTGGHQAGILVPKTARILAFFPKVNEKELNPRHHLIFYDDSGTRWEFAFIYYNNRRFGGTRDEYRLTRMTAYIRGAGLKPGDSVILQTDPDTGRRHVSYQRAQALRKTASGALKLGGTWKEIKI